MLSPSLHNQYGQHFCYPHQTVRQTPNDPCSPDDDPDSHQCPSNAAAHDLESELLQALVADLDFAADSIDVFVQHAEHFRLAVDFFSNLDAHFSLPSDDCC